MKGGDKMDFPTIHISTSDAKIGIETQRPPIRIEQKPAEQTIKQPPADIEIEYRPSKLSIDSTEARADAGLKAPLRYMREVVEKVKIEAQKSVAETVRQGDMLMRIENGGNMIPQLAKMNSFEQLQFGLGYIPSSFDKVELNYDPGEVSVHVKRNEPIIDVVVNKPKTYIQPWSVKTYLKDKASISFEVIGENVSEKV